MAILSAALVCGFLSRSIATAREWERLNTVAFTNDMGEYGFPGLTAGRYLVQALNIRAPVDNRYGEQGKSRLVNVPTYYPSASAPPGAAPVDLAVGAEVRGIDIHLVKLDRPATSVHVRGSVTGLSANSPITVSVSLTAAESGPFMTSTMVNPPDYRFDLIVPPGQYTLSGNVYAGGPMAYRTGSVIVTEDISGVTLPMNPPAYVTGRIVMSESDGPAKLHGVSLSLRRQGDSSVPSARSDAAGKFAFEAPIRPGYFSVAVNPHSLPDRCFVQRIMLGGQEIPADNVAIPASAQFEIVLSNAAGAITGSVSDDENRRVPIASVTLVPADPRSRPMKQAVDGDGNFRIGGLRPGKYKLFAWEEVDDDLWQDPDFLRNYESRAAEITLGPRETQSAQVRVITVESMK
jgi:hypothetical protein